MQTLLFLPNYSHRDLKSMWQVLQYVWGDRVTGHPGRASSLRLTLRYLCSSYSLFRCFLGLLTNHLFLEAPGFSSCHLAPLVLNPTLLHIHMYPGELQSSYMTPGDWSRCGHLIHVQPVRPFAEIFGIWTRGIQVSPSEVTKAVTYNSLEVLAAMF